MHIDVVYGLIADEMQAVDESIRSNLRSHVVLIDRLSHYIITSGGKRLRPVLVLLAAGASGYSGRKHITVAAIIEFIHTATLLHDDVVDSSELRRGRDTANAVWGNEAAVLVGDFLYSRSFQMMVEVGSMRVMEILADTTNTIAEGEVLQLLNVHDADTTEEKYLDIIRSKTAKLFAAAAQLGGVLGDVSGEQEQALATYGMHLGTAFQLIDDVLDYSSCSQDIGKNIGDDLAEGKPTLPLIRAMRKGTPKNVKLVRNAIEQGGREYIDGVLEAIQSTGAIEYTRRMAGREADSAIAALRAVNHNSYRQALAALAEFSVDRKH